MERALAASRTRAVTNMSFDEDNGSSCRTSQEFMRPIAPVTTIARLVVFVFFVVDVLVGGGFVIPLLSAMVNRARLTNNNSILRA